MPLAAFDRSPVLTGPLANHPALESMDAWELAAEVEVCTYFEAHHRAEAEAIGKLNPSGHRDDAFAWYQRRIRVQELLARGGRATG